MQNMNGRRTRLCAAMIVAALAALASGCGNSNPSSVVSATAAVTPGSGSASTTFTFSSVITSTDSTNVSYQWERDTGEMSAVQTLSFGSPGAQTVTYNWQVGGCSTQARSKWVRLVVVSPNNFVSPQATFTVDPAAICV